MPLPLPFRDQYECRDETLEVYASDRRGLIEYKFNNLGYRNNHDYYMTENNAGYFFGSSITSGIGVKWQHSFPVLVSEYFSVIPYHFSQGCTKVDNTEMLKQLRVCQQANITAKFWVIQFIDLDRRFDSKSGLTHHVDDRQQNIEQFVTLFEQVSDVLSEQNWCFFGCDSMDHNIPQKIRKHSRCVAWNPPFIDYAGVGLHPGPNWHQMLALGIEKKLRSN